jgi:hypothetical protein
MHYTAVLVCPDRSIIPAGDSTKMETVMEQVKKTHEDHGNKAKLFVVFEKLRKSCSPHGYLSGATEGGNTGFPAFSVTTSGSCSIPIEIWEDPDFWHSHAGLLGEAVEEGSWPPKQRWATLQRLALHKLGAETSVTASGQFKITVAGKTATGDTMVEAFLNLIGS